MKFGRVGLSQSPASVGLISVIITFLSLLPLWLLTSMDSEEHGFTTQSTIIGATSFINEGSLIWNNFIGLGTPQPFATSWTFHPLLPLFYFFDFRFAVFVFLLVHFLVGSWFLLKILKQITSSPLIHAVALFSFWGSSATFNFMWSDFWPTDFWQYSLLPPLIWCIQKILSDGGASWSIKLFLSLIIVLNVLNGHLGAFFAYLVSIGSGVLIAFPLRRALIQLVPIGLVSFVFSLPKLFVLFSEQKLFSPLLEKTNHPAYPIIDQIRASMVGPFLDFWSPEPFRLIFFGLPFLGFALWSVPKVLKSDDRRIKFVCATFVCTLVFCFLPTRGLFAFVSSTLLFRDVLVTAGVILASYGIERVRSHYSVTARSSLVLQTIQIAFFIPVIWYPLLKCQLGESPGNCVFGAQTQATCSNVPKILLENKEGPGARVYFSPMAESRIIHSNYAFCGVATLNQAYLKGVSSFPLYPDLRKFYGTIRGQNSVLSDATFFTFFGLRYYVAHESEAFPSDFRLLSAPELPKGFVLRENPNWSWGRIFSSSTLSRLAVDPPMRPDCEHKGTLCLNTAAFVKESAPILTQSVNFGITRFELKDTHSVVSGRGAANESILFPVLYRKGWYRKSDAQSFSSEGISDVLGLVAVDTQVLAKGLPTTFSFRGEESILFWASILSLAYLAVATSIFGLIVFRYVKAISKSST